MASASMTIHVTQYFCPCGALYVLNTLLHIFVFKRRSPVHDRVPQLCTQVHITDVHPVSNRGSDTEMYFKFSSRHI